MPLYKSAKIIVEDTSETNPQLHLNDVPMKGDDVVVFEEMPEDGEDIVELHIPQMEVKFSLPTLPGCPEELLEVESDGTEEVEVEDKGKSETSTKDKNEAKDQIEAVDPLDWQSLPKKDFLLWVRNTLARVPRHTGKEILGVQRAIGHLKRLMGDMSKAMQQDFNGEIDVEQLELARDEILYGIDRLEAREEQLLMKKDNKGKKKKAELAAEMVKEGQGKQTHVGGIIITVPIFISRLARICINGSVSAGHDIEKTFEKLSKKYSLTDREQAELMQLLSDMGYMLRRDRGFKIDDDEKYDATSSDNYDYAANYPA